jgi:hypothetical protein
MRPSRLCGETIAKDRLAQPGHALISADSWAEDHQHSLSDVMSVFHRAGRALSIRASVLGYTGPEVGDNVLRREGRE